MLNLALVQTRLGQFWVLWLGTLALTLLLVGGGSLLPGVRLAQVADLVLPPMFTVLVAAAVAFVVMTLLSPQTGLTKAVLVVSGLLLALPLLWAPVLGAGIAAAVAGVSIEYSAAYAQFRIVTSRLIYPLVELASPGSPLSPVWAVFQAFSTVVGFVAALAQVWSMLRRLSRPMEPAD